MINSKLLCCLMTYNITCVLTKMFRCRGSSHAAIPFDMKAAVKVLVKRDMLVYQVLPPSYDLTSSRLR